jgi:hypothetical protein
MSNASVPAAGPPGSPIQCRERRASVRHASTMEASYHPIPVPAVGPACHARIWDVSLGGLALVVPHPYEAGSLLLVVPEVLPRDLAPGLAVRVLHVAPHGSGLWMAGCEFLTPLTEDELRALLS